MGLVPAAELNRIAREFIELERETDEAIAKTRLERKQLFARTAVTRKDSSPSSALAIENRQPTMSTVRLQSPDEGVSGNPS